MKKTVHLFGALLFLSQGACNSDTHSPNDTGKISQTAPDPPPGSGGPTTAAGSSDTDKLPSLETGFYVVQGADCEDVPNAGWRYWTGQGLHGSATKDCVLQVVEQKGNQYAVRQTCTDTYSGSQSDSRDTLTVESATSFRLAGNMKGQLFVRCAQPPSWYR